MTSPFVTAENDHTFPKQYLAYHSMKAPYLTLTNICLHRIRYKTLLLPPSATPVNIKTNEGIIVVVKVCKNVVTQHCPMRHVYKKETKLDLQCNSC